MIFIYNDEKPYDKLSIQYITGLFDAEGNIYIRQRKDKYTSQRIKITQKNDSTLLLKIKEFLDLGQSDDILWKCDNIKIYKNIIDFLKYSVVKKKQLKIFKNFLESKINNRRNYTDEVHNTRKLLYDKLQKELHRKYSL